MQVQEQKPVEKKAYSAPTLTVHGGVEQLTQMPAPINGSRPIVT